MKKRILAFVLACVTVAAFAGCAGTSTQNSDTLKIGGLAPLTGNVSVYGIATNNGIKLAVDEINAAGGINGKQIDYIVYDEKGDSVEAVTAYNKLVQNDGIIALVGDVTSVPTKAVAQEAAKDGIPMITATGTAADITSIGENIFRACFIDPFQGEIMAAYAAERLGAKTAAILYDLSDDYSCGLTDSFVETAAEVGMEVVCKVSYTGGDVDFKAQLTEVAASNPDVLFIPVYYEDAALIAVQAHDVGITATMVGADGWDGVLGSVDASNVSVLEGAYFCNHYSQEDQNPSLQAFITKYKETYNADPNAFAALGYDAMYMMANALKSVEDPTDKAAVVKALAEINYEGITGNIVFDENRNPIKPAAITNILSGEYKYVETYSR